jgi:hypothetical protein
MSNPVPAAPHDEADQAIEIDVKPGVDGVIRTNTTLVTKPGTREEAREVMLREVMDTKDALIQQGLKSLGWTPPKELAPIVADVDMLVDAIIGRGFSSKTQIDAALKYGYCYKTVTEIVWDRKALKMLTLRKLLAIYTDGSLNG